MSADENKHTSPAADNGAITAFGTTWPAAKFKLDANGRNPHGIAADVTGIDARQVVGERSQLLIDCGDVVGYAGPFCTLRGPVVVGAGTFRRPPMTS